MYNTQYFVLQELQLEGMMCISYFIRNKLMHNFNNEQKKKMLGTLLSGMFCHKDDTDIITYGYYAIFTIIQDVVINLISYKFIYLNFYLKRIC